MKRSILIPLVLILLLTACTPKSQNTPSAKEDINATETPPAEEAPIPEELYNCLGPVQDTLLRQDSLIYQYSNEAQRMTAEDLLILQLLYHPSIRPGMTAAECKTAIYELYY